MFIGEQGYLNLLKVILDFGEEREDRTGTGTISAFGHRMEFDISNSFPLFTTKKVSMKNIITELLWFLQGDRRGNISYLLQNNNKIWKKWVDEDNNLGPVYGAQWRNWPSHRYFRNPYGGYYVEERYIDQIKKLIWDLKNNPYSRRHIVSAWNVAELDDMALAPCHLLMQFYVTGAGELDCQLYQRSADMFLGVPYNVASYSALTYMIAQVTGLRPRKFIWVGGDCHIYKNHIEQVSTQISRKIYNPPVLEVAKKKDIDSYNLYDFKLYGYESHPFIKGEISV